MSLLPPPPETIDITTDTDPNDPTLYLAAAARALHHYRQAVHGLRHAVNDLILFEMIENATADGEYGSGIKARTVISQAIETNRHIDHDPNGYGWEWWHEQTHDLLESLGYERSAD